jgi:hypothetical protein
MRKFLERCGFVLESIMRKYRIVNRRNRDIAVYVVFNSDWEQVCIYTYYHYIIIIIIIIIHHKHRRLNLM